MHARAAVWGWLSVQSQQVVLALQCIYTAAAAAQLWLRDRRREAALRLLPSWVCL